MSAEETPISTSLDTTNPVVNTAQSPKKADPDPYAWIDEMEARKQARIDRELAEYAAKKAAREKAQQEVVAAQAASSLEEVTPGEPNSATTLSNANQVKTTAPTTPTGVSTKQEGTSQVSSSSPGAKTTSSPTGTSSKEEVDPLTRTPVQFTSEDTIDAIQPEIIVFGFDINSFRSNIHKNGVLPNHSYLVKFYPFRVDGGNAFLNNLRKELEADLSFRCENVVLPTVSLLLEDPVRRFGYGPVEKVPYGVQFSEVTMTWIADKYSDLNNFFYQWMNTIVNYESRGGILTRNNVRDGLETYSSYEVGFRDSYACPKVDIEVFDYSQKTVTTYSLFEVFPTAIQSMNLSWADENQLQKINITFAFTDMVTADVSEDRPPKRENGEPQKSSNEERTQRTNLGEEAAADVTAVSADPTSSVKAEKPFAGQDANPTVKSTAGQTQTESAQVKDPSGNPI